MSEHLKPLAVVAGAMKGEGDVVHGLKNKLQAAAAAITPESQLAEPLG